MTGLLGTGTLGKLGYAIAWGSQGTTGNFPGGFIQQTALLQTSVVNPGIGTPFRPSSKASPPPPDLTNANAFNEVNYYPVSGGYVQRNFVGKLVYDFSPKTTLQFTIYSAQDWSNSTGEGDNDYETFPYVLYGAQQTLASIEATKKGLNTILVNGKPQSCHDSIAVLIDNPQGYTCMTPAQYAVNFYGPFGGSIDRWRTLGDVDYDARATQQLGSGLITLEGFDDNYNYNEQKGPGAAIGPYGPGPNYLDLYGNRGYLLSDDFAMSKNDFGFGYSWLHQANTNGSFPYTLANGTTYNTFGNNPPLYLATASYFVRDTWTPNDKFSAFGSFWLQRSLDTSSTHFDPRVSLIYRPSSSDVIRLTGGPFVQRAGPVAARVCATGLRRAVEHQLPSGHERIGSTRLDRLGGESDAAAGDRGRPGASLRPSLHPDDEHSSRRLSIAREPGIAQRQRVDRRFPRDHRSKRLYRQGARAPELVPRPSSDDP